MVIFSIEEVKETVCFQFPPDIALTWCGTLKWTEASIPEVARSSAVRPCDSLGEIDLRPPSPRLHATWHLPATTTRRGLEAMQRRRGALSHTRAARTCHIFDLVY